SGAFDAVWVGDSLLAKPRLESIALLSALSAITKKVRLAVGCMATFPHRHPALLAQQWASLDVISNGRAWLAVCLGGPNEQSPAVERGLRRVARFADGWMTNKVTPEEFRSQWKRIQAMAREEGRDPVKMGSSLYHNINIKEDRKAALDESKAFLDKYYTSNFSMKFVAGFTTAGTPKQCIEELRAYFAAGLDHITLRMTSWDQTGQLNRFLKEVAPAFL